MTIPPDEEHFQEHLDDQMVIIQANIDDMIPEWTSYVTDQLLAKGANDVYWIPMLMKKGRPGIMLNVLAHQNLIPTMEEIIFQETTTIGVRYMMTVCHRLERKWVHVRTKWGDVPVKLAYYQGKLVQFAPEYRICEKMARDHQVPLKDVYEAVRASVSIQ